METKKLSNLREKTGQITAWLGALLLRAIGHGIGVSLSVAAAEGILDLGTDRLVMVIAGGVGATARIVGAGFLARYPDQP